MRNQFELIAAGVTTLDEARYFSAMGVDWLGFNGSLLSSDEMKTITDWIVGPKLFVEFGAFQEDLLFEVSNKIQLHAISVPLEALIPSWYEGIVIRQAVFPLHLPMLKHAFNSVLLVHLNASGNVENSLDALRSICAGNICWLEYDPSQHTFHELSEHLPLHGIVIRTISNAPDAVDVYQQYDMILEQLANLRAS